MQQLWPHEIEAWHATLLKVRRQKPPAAVGAHRRHAHRVQRAVETEVLARNVASAISPPKVQAEEIQILDQHQIKAVVDKLAELDHPLHDITVVDRDCGLRFKVPTVTFNVNGHLFKRDDREAARAIEAAMT